MVDKILMFLAIILMTLGCSIQRHPLALNPGPNSNKTGLPYNFPFSNFQVFKYQGSREDLAIKFKRNNIKLTSEDLENGRKLFDSISINNQNFTPYNPPGCMYIKDNLFMDDSEVTNLEYQEFLFYIKRDSSDYFYSSQIPDYLDSGDASEKEISMHDYFYNPAYRFFPVVGVSHTQAQHYCKWRSQIVTLSFNEKFSEDSKFTYFNFRLPSEEEWELVASSGFEVDKYPLGVKDEGVQIKAKVNSKYSSMLVELAKHNSNESRIVADIKKFNKLEPHIPVFNVSWDSPYFLDFKYPFYVFGFPSNDFGIYGMIGGVSEMVEEDGVVKGGSWNNTLDEISYNKRFINADALEVGFRCVCEVELLDRNAYNKYYHP